MLSAHTDGMAMEANLVFNFLPKDTQDMQLEPGINPLII